MRDDEDILCVVCGAAIEPRDAIDECCGDGPYCEDCYVAHLRAEHRCSSCGGRGEVRVLRDGRGRVDYLRGRWNGHEWTCCSLCHGEGYRL